MTDKTRPDVGIRPDRQRAVCLELRNRRDSSKQRLNQYLDHWLEVWAKPRLSEESEEKIGALRKKIWERLPSRGALLIAEKLLGNDKTGPLRALMQSLNTLVCTEGKKRTLAEYTALLRQAGFTHVDGTATASPLDAILAVKG